MKLRLFLIACFTTSVVLLGLAVGRYIYFWSASSPSRGPLCIQQQDGDSRIWHPHDGVCKQADAPAWPEHEPGAAQFVVDVLYPQETVGPERKFIVVPIDKTL